MREIKQKISMVEEGIGEMYEYVNGLQQAERDIAREALRHAFDAGRTFHELEHIPAEPPFGLDGQLKLGPILREHVLQARKVYAHIGQLREIIADLLDEDAETLLKAIQPPEKTSSGTASTELAA